MAVTESDVKSMMDTIVEEELEQAGVRGFEYVQEQKRQRIVRMATECALGWVMYHLAGFCLGTDVQGDAVTLIGIVAMVLLIVSAGFVLRDGGSLLIRLFMGEQRENVAYIRQMAEQNPDAEIAQLIGRAAMENLPPKRLKEAAAEPGLGRILLRRIGAVLLALCVAVISPVLDWVEPKVYASQADPTGSRREEHTCVPYGDGVMLTMGGSAYIGEKELVIPAEVEGKKVVAIATLAFSGFSAEKVVIPDSVQTLGSGVFKNCKNLRSVQFGKGVYEIGAECFMGCERLESVEIPSAVTEIRGNTFEGCIKLKNVQLHDGITAIHGYAFKRCKALAAITLPKGITEIRGNTFENCTSLTSIRIPGGVTRIAAHAFRGCSALSEVSVPSTVREIGSSAFRECSSLRQISIPVWCQVNERAFKDSPTRISRR